MLFNQLEDSVTHLTSYPPPQITEDFESLHKRLLSVSGIESEVSTHYRNVLKVKHEVDVSKERANAALADAEMEATSTSSFKNPLTNFTTRPEVDAKLRALTIEETHEVRTWKTLSLDVQYLLDVVRSYQLDLSRQRRDIETRLKLNYTF